jgi:ubiquinone/menaquinone biosynthesis C-methylase UbiE
MVIHQKDPTFPLRPTGLAQEILRSEICQGDLAIDATAGNGHDTLFLAECVGVNGHVLAFDVQLAAIESARCKITEANYQERVKFIHESHSMMDRHVEENSVAGIMFNLGYLPGEGHELTTTRETTQIALSAAVRLLKPGGMLSVICYPGHPSGEIEAAGVESWMVEQASKGWRVAKYGSIGTRRPAPFLLISKAP